MGGGKILHSKIYGQGRPVVLLHGVFGLSANWVPLAMMLSGSGFQVHALDLRGHGRSFRGADMSLAAMADDVRRYMEANGLEKAAILGHSMGGKIAMDFACRHPECCRELIVVDISPRAYDPGRIKELAETAIHIEDFEPRSREEARSMLEQQIGDAGWQVLLAQNLYRQENGAYGFRFDARLIRDNAALLIASLPADYSFKGKVLLVRGGDSNYITREDEAILKKYFPAFRIVSIAGARHWVHADAPVPFSKTVSDFLRE